MCTVSIVPRADGFRLMCNRDEQLTRPAAIPPARTTLGEMDAVLPIDARSGGTWIGVNGVGVAAALLNRTPRLEHRACERPSKPPSVRSRGEIVPRLLRATNTAGVVAELQAIDCAVYAPFRVIAAWNHQLVIATWCTPTLHIVSRRLTQPRVFTSSSLGDARALRLRFPLFSRLVVHADDRLAGQRDFHDHRWPDCPAFSVRMQRPDARTVSRSVVDARRGVVSLSYEPLPQEA